MQKLKNKSYNEDIYNEREEQARQDQLEFARREQNEENDEN